jgi:hypothetical protein
MRPSYDDSGPPLGGPLSLASPPRPNPLLYPFAGLVISFAAAVAALVSTIAGLLTG